MAAKKCKLKILKVAALEKGRTYGIKRLHLAETSHAEKNSVRKKQNAAGHDSKLIFAHRKIGQITNKIQKDKCIVHECNILTNILNPKKHARQKSHYHYIYSVNNITQY